MILEASRLGIIAACFILMRNLYLAKNVDVSYKHEAGFCIIHVISQSYNSKQNLLAYFINSKSRTKNHPETLASEELTIPGSFDFLIFYLLHFTLTWQHCFERGKISPVSSEVIRAKDILSRDLRIKNACSFFMRYVIWYVIRYEYSICMIDIYLKWDISKRL